MKRILIFGLTLLMGIPGIVQEVDGQTKVFDQTITWEHPPYQYGGYGFYWWHRTDGYSIINYGNMPSNNWVSPNDYYNGNFTMSVEVISQPTNEPFYIQFGIWGDKHKGGSHTETVAGRKRVDGGAGSSGSWGLGSPSGWWNKQAGDHLDFSRANDFYRIGVVLWDGADVCIPMGKEWSSSGCPGNAYKYFPMTIKISVYATTGSGPPPPPPPPPPTVTAPNYSIDYWGERTNKVVSTEDQYSYNSDFSNSVDGNGQYLYLTPGTTVYFRKKADYSKKQTLTVPGRPAAPTFGIDYANQRTSAVVSAEYQHSANSDMSSSSTGDGSHVSLTPGSDKFFLKKASGSAFASNKQTLTVPGRPAAPSFEIDYMKEEISTPIGAGYSYSNEQDMSAASQGSENVLMLTPGETAYFQELASVSAFASEIQMLESPARPAAPSLNIDYTSETTGNSISTEIQYSASAGFETVEYGAGAALDLMPGVDQYFRYSATPSSYSSEVYQLQVPERPVVSSSESVSTELYPFMVEFTFFQEVSLLDEGNVSVVNAELKNLNLKNQGSSESIFEAQVFATATDVISIKVPANTVQDGNFISEAFELDFAGQLPGVGIESLSASSFSVYPNPGKGVFYLKFEEYDGSATYMLEVTSLTGKVAHTKPVFGPENVSLDLSDFADGIYLMRLLKDGQVSGSVKLMIN